MRTEIRLAPLATQLSYAGGLSGRLPKNRQVALQSSRTNRFCKVQPRYAKLRCDFVVEDRKLIIEYDERQHFTALRRIALQNYPPDIVLNYSATEWMKYCDEIDAHDNDPLFRDERRALYDSVRDIAAFRNGWTLLRIKYGNVDWKTASMETLDHVLDHGCPHNNSQ